MSAMKNKKWSADKVKAVQAWVINRWPDLFTPGPDLKPLALKVHKQILEHRDENPMLTRRVVEEVLNRHTSSFGYLYGLLKHRDRVDLNNAPVGEVSLEQRRFARATLKTRQRAQQKMRRGLKARKSNKRNDNRGKSQSAPVISYKSKHRKLTPS